MHSIEVTLLQENSDKTVKAFQGCQQQKTSDDFNCHFQPSAVTGCNP